MATFDYDGLAADVLELLQEFGISVTLKRTPTGVEGAQSYDPGSAEFYDSVVADVSGTGVLVGYKANEVDDDTVRKTDRKLLYQGAKLKIGDMYGDFRVHQIKEIDPSDSGSVILAIAQMRK